MSEDAEFVIEIEARGDHERKERITVLEQQHATASCELEKRVRNQLGCGLGTKTMRLPSRL